MKKISQDSTWSNSLLQETLKEIESLKESKNDRVHKIADILELLINAFDEMDRKLGFTKDHISDVQDEVKIIENGLAARIRKEKLARDRKEKKRLMAITPENWKEF